ncbi:CAMK/CDPK protein kinase [Sphaeroforma arctica JP610]|uniref:CAMK/CDPK protein kinase n=1 Tax=Sphaeroforma arctica JP610 TaxID=667725 RepID=A0A0L0G0A5_9EUKA|nr:CAMK/CDPK protein kinase [Sphaeroforma arctica JP610]KNC82284.1 CAMK/CDPK protein kinase [Sphaeroforma arctica JP610]|eukprot:XP_014156186.1 CAMK/CDPK protein kinase [Sphaeroforma arctica JP610]
MELLPYGELLDVLAHAMASNYGEPQVAIIFRQVASAVDHCHRNGVVHADLKLENIFCLSANVKTVEALKNATLKLGDFGAAIELEEGKFATGGVGTFNYMPPERLLQQGFTEKADVWGLGVLLYALIAGRLPFPGQDRQTVLHWVKQGPDMSLDEFAAVSPLAVELIRKMLHPDPNQRPSVAHVLENKWMMGNVQQTAVLGKTLTSLRRQNMARKFRAATRLLMAGGRVVRIARAMKAEELMMDMAGYDIHPQDILSLSAAFFAATGGGLYVEKKVFGQVMATVLQMHDYELVDAVYDAYWECERHQAAISDLSDTVRNNASILIQRRRTLSYLGKSGMHTQSDGNLVKNRRNDNSDEVITNDATDSVYPDSQSLGSDVLVVEEDWEVPLGEGRDATLVAQHVGPPRQGICLDCAEGDRHCTTHTQTHGTMEMAEVSTQTAPGKLADALCSCVDKAACVCKEVEKVTKQACAKGKSKGLAMGATMTMPEPKRFEAFDSGDVAAPRQQVNADTFDTSDTNAHYETRDTFGANDTIDTSDVRGTSASASASASIDVSPCVEDTTPLRNNPNSAAHTHPDTHDTKVAQSNNTNSHDMQHSSNPANYSSQSVIRDTAPEKDARAHVLAAPTNHVRSKGDPYTHGLTHRHNPRNKHYTAPTHRGTTTPTAHRSISTPDLHHTPTQHHTPNTHVIPRASTSALNSAFGMRKRCGSLRWSRSSEPLISLDDISEGDSGRSTDTVVSRSAADGGGRRRSSGTHSGRDTPTRRNVLRQMLDREGEMYRTGSSDICFSSGAEDGNDTDTSSIGSYHSNDEGAHPQSRSDSVGRKLKQLPSALRTVTKKTPTHPHNASEGHTIAVGIISGSSAVDAMDCEAALSLVDAYSHERPSARDHTRTHPNKRTRCTEHADTDDGGKAMDHGDRGAFSGANDTDDESCVYSTDDSLSGDDGSVSDIFGSELDMSYADDASVSDMSVRASDLSDRVSEMGDSESVTQTRPHITHTHTHVLPRTANETQQHPDTETLGQIPLPSDSSTQTNTPPPHTHTTPSATTHTRVSERTDSQASVHAETTTSALTPSHTPAMKKGRVPARSVGFVATVAAHDSELDAHTVAVDEHPYRFLHSTNSTNTHTTASAHAHSPGTLSDTLFPYMGAVGGACVYGVHGASVCVLFLLGWAVYLAVEYGEVFGSSLGPQRKQRRTRRGSKKGLGVSDGTINRSTVSKNRLVGGTQTTTGIHPSDCVRGEGDARRHPTARTPSTSTHTDTTLPPSTPTHTHTRTRTTAQNDPTEPSGATKKEKPVIGMCNTTDAQKGFANRNLTHIVTKMLGAGGSHETHRPPEAMHTPPEVRVNRMSAPNSKRVGVDEPGPSNLGYGDGRHGNCTGSAEMEGAVAGADAQTRRLTPLPEKDNDDTNKGTASRKTSGMGPLKSIRPSAMSRPSDATVQQRRQTLMHDQVKCINHLNFLLSISGKLDLPVPVMAQLCFDLVDRDHTLFIDKREFRVFIESVLMIVVAGDVVDFDVVVDREFETCDKSGDGLISVSEFVSASSRSTLLKRYQDALARMWLTRNELFNSELETLHQSAQGWVSLNFGAQGGGGLMMTTGPWNKRYIALHDRRYLSVWKKYEDFASGVLGDRVYELSPEHVAMTMFIPVVLPNYGDYKVQAGRIKTRPRIKLAFSDGDCLILQAKSQRVMNMWEDLLIETGISHWRKQTVI